MADSSLPTSACTPSAPTVNRSMQIRAAASVLLRRIETGHSLVIGDHPVTDTTHGGDRASPERCVHLTAQRAHIHLDDVRIALIRHVPHLVQDLPLGDRTA